MNKNKLLLLAVVITYQLINVSTAFCLDLGFSHEDGGRPGAFLSYGAGARSLAMGKTFVGVADDASTTYWNPAGLATLQKPEITALYASMYEKTGYSFASGVYPLKSALASSLQPSASSSFGTLGLAIVNLSSRGFQLRDEYNYEQGEGGVSETAAIVSYGMKPAECLRLEAESLKNVSLGVNLKVVNQNVNTKSDTGYGIDVGVLYKHNDSDIQHSAFSLQRINIGLSIQNLIAPKLTLIEDTDKYPLSTTLGFSYRFFNNNLLTALDLNKTENRQLKVHLGTEYTLAKLFSIRAGLDETEATFGMGVKWQNYSLDYAFAYHDAWKGYEDLGISHRFGLTVRFGK
ncbi:MAG: PorV/PorQ family protein [bacterium]|nr:PorV/PorQ family protein [bacterium]